MTWQLDINGGETPHEHVVGVAPGDKCPTCERRLPHPKKADSPQSKVWAMRLPNDEVDAHNELTEALADHLGISTSEKFWKWKTDAMAKVIALQTPAHVIAQLLEGKGG